VVRVERSKSLYFRGIQRLARSQEGEGAREFVGGHLVQLAKRPRKAGRQRSRDRSGIGQCAGCFRRAQEGNLLVFLEHFSANARVVHDLVSRVLVAFSSTVDQCPSLGIERGEGRVAVQLFSMHFEADRSAILRSVSFRRLAGKTQVLIAPEDAALRTRLTHTLEVADLSRTVALALGLDASLAEAIALAHDIGHPAFGHAGERALARLAPRGKGFHHAAHGVRVVTVLEPLGLQSAVLDGILKHSKGRSGPVEARGSAGTTRAEAHVVRACDLFAYAIHDVDDAVDSGLLSVSDLPLEARDILGDDANSRREALLLGLIEGTREASSANTDAGETEPTIRVLPATLAALDCLRDHMYRHVYEAGPVAAQTERAKRIVDRVFAAYVLDEERALAWARRAPSPATDNETRAVDFVASLGDREAMALDARLHGVRVAA
jgi:dGTPase